MKLPPLPSLRAFESAARRENFRQAATELGMTPAAVSQHVRSLEDWLGVRLFERSARGVRLTPAGREFGSAVTAGLAGIAAAAERLTAAARRRTVRLACLPSVVTHWLAPRLPRFRAAHPDIQVAISYAAGAKTASEAASDLLIQHGARPDAGAVPILSGATHPTCAPAYLHRKGPIRDPRDLLEADLLHDESPAAWWRWFAEGSLESPREAGPIFADFNLLLSSLTAGLGVALCPTALIADELSRGELEILFDRPTDMEKAYWLTEAASLSPEAVLMRDWLLAEAAAATLPAG
ncbi:LysR substrate-binding domain-containing protein [Ciceribacter ferrooxidans]|uniref:LysR family transcriptional regulator n=1 Tax=Ciceribacter ferrooxidans TaxID=2509717 RepID=A0A4Q2TJ58_9HYPH|nr:LysR substrate-binding domain-containing protein [Ciceribacter ferrooxidans]RYC17396.1 LysR family transcriptional regulator [Ciceribacter ferrooxidans]